MRLLHTSDWHLGRALYGRQRYDEFEAFLAWLLQTLQTQSIDALLVAGDVFDTSAPSHRAQQLYYQFLRQVADSACRHVVVIAGNHDSPSFLNAPKAILEPLDVHVIGASADDPQDEVLVLDDHAGDPALIVCAVPYLRDRDIRRVEAGESIEDKERKLIEGIRDHYATVAALAERQRATLGRDIPIVAMGHLFTAGGRTIDGDGVRELYIGSLAHVSARLFPACFDYVALGHLHVPQTVGGSERLRYSGSPLPMGFGEARQRKSVSIVECRATSATVQTHEVPVFQALERIRGDWEGIARRIDTLAAAGSRAWLEIVYDADAIVGDLRERLDAAINGSALEILRVHYDPPSRRAQGLESTGETLDALSVDEVFERCLAFHDLPEAQRTDLRHTYQETLSSLYDEDRRAQ